MSRERCQSLDRALREKQRPTIYGSGGYIPGRSPSRSPTRRVCEAPRHVPSSPEIFRYATNVPSYALDEFEVRTPRQFQRTEELQYDHPLEELSFLEAKEHPQPEVRPPQFEDLPDELLEEYEEPSFYEPPPNASFDEVMCAFASPRPATPQMIRPSEKPTRQTPVTLETEHPIEDKAQTPLCPYVMEPLPDDPYEIPPHPKDPEDVVAIIRRARAIHRLKALQEEEEAKAKQGVAVTEKTETIAKRPKKAAQRKSQIGKAIPKADKAKKKQQSTVTAEHPPDYIEPEYAAAILRARQLAGLKTRNPKLLPKPSTPAAPSPRAAVASTKSPLAVNRTLQSPAARSPLPTYENIMRRIAAIRAKTDTAKEALYAQKSPRGPREQVVDQLDEFEALEQFYGAHATECALEPRQDQNLSDRIENLKRQLLETPPAQKAPASPVFELPPIIRYYDLIKRQDEMLRQKTETAIEDECPMPEYDVDLQQIQGIADWQLADLSAATVCPSPAHETSKIDKVKMVYPQTKDISDIADVSAYLLSDEEFSDSRIDLDQRQQEELFDISMPKEFVTEDSCPTELGIEDITSPELDDLSISLPEALEPDYPLELSLDKTQGEHLQSVGGDQHQTPGFLTSVVSAVVDKFRNIFATAPMEEEGPELDKCSFNLDTSLPNLFEKTPPPPQPQMTSKACPTDQKLKPQKEIPTQPSAESPIVIPPFPKDPKDYATMVKIAQLIQKRKAREAKEVDQQKIEAKKQKNSEIKSSIPKRAAAPSTKVLSNKKKAEPPPKVYPPGEYSPSYAAAVARARVLAGYKNRSAILNPQRAAKIAALKAQREAALAAEESLPPVERMRKRIARIREKRGQLLCRQPSIDTLAALEAIRETLPKPETPSLTVKRKWTPAKRSLKSSDEVFSKQYERALEKLKPMSPIREETYDEGDLMQFSPLRPHEGKLRLQYLRNQALRRQAESEVCPKTPLRTPEISTDITYTPISLGSPSPRPRTEEIRKEIFTTKIDDRGFEESVREEILETSKMENGQMQTTTRKVTTTTDEYGNVISKVEEEKSQMTGNDGTIMENIESIEAPEFLDTSAISTTRDPTIPTPSELIEKIRLQVQQKLQVVLPRMSLEPTSPTKIDFPKDLPEEQLFEVDMPELAMTSPKGQEAVPFAARERSPNVSLPYCLGEVPSSSPPPASQHVSPPRPTSPKPETTAENTASKITSPEKPIIIPPPPKDPKDYVAMVKYAQLIQKLKKQEEDKKAALPPSPPPVTTKKAVRVPIPRKATGPKGRAKKPKKLQEDKHEECPAEPPPIPAEYAAAVARARQLAGYKNTTALLNPEAAAKIAAEKAAKEAELAEFEKLPAYQKVMKRMEKLRKLPQTRKIQPSADVLGMIEAIRANMPPMEELLPQPTATTPTGTRHSPVAAIQRRSQAYTKPTSEKLDRELTNKALKESETIEQTRLDQSCQLSQKITTPSLAEETCPRSTSLEEFEALEREAAITQRSEKITIPKPTEVSGPLSTSLDEFEALEKETANLTGLQTITKPDLAEETCPKSTSLDEFEALERQATEVSCPLSESLDEFEALERQAAAEHSIAHRMAELQTKLYGKSVTPRGASRAKPRRRNIMDELNPVEDQEFYKELIAEFGPKQENFQAIRRRPVDNLMLATPVCPKERFRQIKEAQSRPLPLRETAVYEDQTGYTPLPAYSPIPFSTPSGTLGPAETRDAIPVTTTHDGVLIDLQTPHHQFKSVKQFKDLADMPFDELEFEDVPAFADISFDKPISPPPQPSELIDRIRKQVQKRLREEEDRKEHSLISYLGKLPKFPEELPEEELFDLSAPTFAQTPVREISQRERSPRVSLPYAWGELAPTTPAEPAATIPTRTPASVPPEPQLVVEVVEGPKVVSPEGPIIIPPFPKDPKDYKAMVKISQAIHKLEQQKAAEKAAAAPSPGKEKRAGRITLSKLGKRPLKEGKTQLRKKLVMKKKIGDPLTTADTDGESPAEPPPIPADYAAAVAHARRLAGYKNTTAALNPEIAAKIAKEKAEAEAAAAAFAALSEHEKLKLRMEKLKSKTKGKPRVKPTMEQLAFLQHLKETCPTTPSNPSPQNVDVTETETQKVMASIPQRLSITPRAKIDKGFSYSEETAEFEKLEQMEFPRTCTPAKALPPLKINQMIEKMQQQQLGTPRYVQPQERYKQLLTQMQAKPRTPQLPTPIKSPDIHYTPVTLQTSPTLSDRFKRTEKSTHKISKSGKNTIEEEITESSKIVNGELQEITTHVTTTTDPAGNVTSQINESKQVTTTADTSAVNEELELENIDEPSFLDITPPTPSAAPRPKDIIDRIRKEVQSRPPRPEVPMGRLIELRTPPRQLPLPQEVPAEDLLAMTFPQLPKTPAKSPTQPLPRRSLERTPNISLPEVFAATPEPPTPPLPPVSPLRYRIPSPEGPIVIPPYPKDPTDYAAMVRMSRKIQELKAQQEAEAIALAQAEAAAAKIEASKPKKKTGRRRKLVMKKREQEPGKASATQLPAEPRECPTEPPPLPEGYAEQVAKARQLAGLKNRTAALNPKVAEREAAKAAADAEAARLAQEREAARLAALNAPPPPPADYGTLMARITEMRKQGYMPEAKPSIAATAYLEAMKVMDAPVPVTFPSDSSPIESPETRYKRIVAAKAKSPRIIEEISTPKTPQIEDIPRYTPIPFGSPREKSPARVFPLDGIEFDMGKFEGLPELGVLGDLEEPSFMEISDRYTLSTPRTPQPTPSRLISRIRERVLEQLKADRVISPTRPQTTPQPLPQPPPLSFPHDLDEEELFELSAPDFPQTPQKPQTPIARSPNISIPQYFEKTLSPELPTRKLPTPKITPPKPDGLHSSKSPPPQPTALTEEEKSPPLMGVHPGLRVRTPQGPNIVIPSHPIDPSDVVAMIQRAQLIQKMKNKQEAERMQKTQAVRKLAKAIKPGRTRPGGPPPRITTKSLKVDDKDEVQSKKEADPMRLDSPVEPPQLPYDYAAAVARARTMAGLKNTTALLNPPKPPQDYATIMARVAALRAQIGEIEEPNELELEEAQNVIRRRRQAKQQEASDILKTPPPAIERYRTLRSRKPPTETPISSQIPYTPTQAANAAELPTYTPIQLATTPVCPFLQNISEPDLGDISMPPELYNQLVPSPKCPTRPNIMEPNIGDISMPPELYNELVSSPKYPTTQNITEPELDIGDISMPPELYNQLEYSSRCPRTQNITEPELDIGDISMPPELYNQLEYSSRCPRTQNIMVPELDLRDISMPPELYDQLVSSSRRPRAQLITEPNIGDISMPPDLYNQFEFSPKRRTTQNITETELDIGDISMPPELYDQLVSSSRCPRAQHITEPNIGDISMPPDLYNQFEFSPKCRMLQNISGPDIGDISMPAELNTDFEEGMQYQKSPRQLSMSPRTDRRLPEESMESFELAEFEALEQCNAETPTNRTERTQKDIRARESTRAQYQQSPRQLSMTPRTVCRLPEDSIESFELAEFEALEQFNAETPTNRNERNQKDSRVREPMRAQYQQSPRQLSMTPRTVCPLPEDSIESFELAKFKALEQCNAETASSKCPTRQNITEPKIGDISMTAELNAEIEQSMRTQYQPPLRQLSMTPRNACRLPQNSIESFELAEFEAFERYNDETPLNRNQQRQMMTEASHKLAKSPPARITTGKYSAVQSLQANEGMCRTQHRR